MYTIQSDHEIWFVEKWIAFKLSFSFCLYYQCNLHSISYYNWQSVFSKEPITFPPALPCKDRELVFLIHHRHSLCDRAHFQGFAWWNSRKRIVKKLKIIFQAKISSKSIVFLKITLIGTFSFFFTLISLKTIWCIKLRIFLHKFCAALIFIFVKSFELK